jgi:hypothetical protein
MKNPAEKQIFRLVILRHACEMQKNDGSLGWG